MNTTPRIAANASPTERDPGRSAGHSIWTLSALGFLAYYIPVMWHEIQGHGLTAYLMGAHHFLLTSTSMTSPDSVISAPLTLGDRFVFLNGPLSNGALGLVLYQVYRFYSRKNANLTLRFFLWLLTALNFFLGFVYMFYSGLFGF